MSVKNNKESNEPEWVRLFNSVTSISSMGVHVVDLNTREMYFSNEAGFRLINEEPCDYQGRTCYEVFFGLDHPCANCRLEHTKQGFTKHETYVPEADKTFLTNTEITKWEGKDVLIEYITDITAMKKDQKGLKVAGNIYQKRIEILMQSYPHALGSFVMNLNHDYVTQQRRLHSYIPVQSDSNISNYIEGMKSQMSEFDFERYEKTFSRKNLIKIYESGEQQISLTHRYKFKDRNRWIMTCARLLFNPITKDLEAYVFAVDVTDKVLSDQVINKMISLRYDILALIYPNEGLVDFRYAGNEFENIPEITICEYDKNRYQASSLFGESEGNLYIKNTDLNTIIKMLNQEGTYSFTMKLMMHGQLHYKRYTYNYLTEEKDIILTTVQDVTKIIEKENEQMHKIETAMAKAQKANAAKTEFLATMSHDMRTPMNGILGLVALMMEQELPKEIKEDLKQIQLSGKYLLNLINDTLDINKIEANMIELHPTISDAFKTLKNIKGNGHILAAEKGINFVVEEINPEEITNTLLYIDQSRVEQIFMNILSNAVKYTPEGGNVRFTIERIETTEDYVIDRYQMIDSGIGMSKNFIQHIYEPFSQECRGVTTRENGTGLGMSIAYRLVKLLDGSIDVKSKINEGTTFTLQLKFDRYKGESDTNSSTETVCSNWEGKRVLLCEDHPLNRKIATKFLEKKGLLVETVENGKDGVTKFEKSSNEYYDLILMDVRMPVMDGLTATRTIRALNKTDAKKIPIIAMTANAFHEDVKNCIDAGMNAHIPKPFDIEKVYQTIDMYLK